MGLLHYDRRRKQWKGEKRFVSHSIILREIDKRF
jgi:hypothetical protein